MIIPSLEIPKADFEAQTGWSLMPEGACKGDRCVPLREIDLGAHTVDVRMLTETLGMPIVHDEAHGLYAVGPESGGPLLTSAECPEMSTQVASVIPPLPGAQYTVSTCALWANFQHSACSRPPLPMTSTFMTYHPTPAAACQGAA